MRAVDDAERGVLRALDCAQQRLVRGRTTAVLRRLVRDLADIRSAVPVAVWRAAVRHVVPSHALIATMLASPLTRRLRAKPRGADCDAILLDMLYGVGENLDCSPLGAAVYAFERALPSAASMRRTSAQIRDELVQLAATCPDAQVLALACGHLRELDATTLARFGAGARFVAVDADEDGLASVRRRLVDPRVRTVCANPRTVAERARRAGRRFDLVYRIVPSAIADDVSCGDRLAAGVSLLRPGGVLMLAVPATGRPDAAYLEACLDWWVVERDADAIGRRAANVAGCRERTVYLDPYRAFVVLRLVRDAQTADRTKFGRYEDEGALR